MSYSYWCYVHYSSLLRCHRTTRLIERPSKYNTTVGIGPLWVKSGHHFWLIYFSLSLLVHFLRPPRSPAKFGYFSFLRVFWALPVLSKFMCPIFMFHPISYIFGFRVTVPPALRSLHQFWTSREILNNFRSGDLPSPLGILPDLGRPGNCL